MTPSGRRKELLYYPQILDIVKNEQPICLDIKPAFYDTNEVAQLLRCFWMRLCLKGLLLLVSPKQLDQALLLLDDKEGLYRYYLPARSACEGLFWKEELRARSHKIQYSRNRNKIRHERLVGVRLDPEYRLVVG